MSQIIWTIQYDLLVKYKESSPLDSTDDSDSNNESSLENSSSESGAEDDLISPSIDYKSSETEPYFGLQGNLTIQFGGLTRSNENFMNANGMNF